MTALKNTVLANWHQQRGARMVPFAGYNMPVQYPTGVLAEHLHTRDKAGLFDVSHMGQIQVLGDDADRLLESVFPADLLALPVNRQTYSFLLNDEGGVIDDLMICRRDNDFLLVVNAGCKHNDLAVLQQRIGQQLQLQLLDDRALLALQGPQAATVLTELGADVSGLRFMQGDWLEIAGIECWATRSGYTGEDGFELSVAADRAEALANLLAGHPAVLPAGLGARDSLRLEAGLCLYGHELDEHTTPVEAGLIWAIARARRSGGERAGGFTGAERILAQIADRSQLDKQRIALVAQGRAPVRDGAALFDANGQHAGTVSSGGFAPSLNKPVALAYVEQPLVVGDTVHADVRGKKLPMDVTSLPFVPHRYCRG